MLSEALVLLIFLTPVDADSEALVSERPQIYACLLTQRHLHTLIQTRLLMDSDADVLKDLYALCYAIQTRLCC